MDKQFIDKLAFIYLKDKQILMTLSKGNDTYYIPGGKREGDETDMEALKREVKEELTVDLIDNSIKYYGTFEAQAHGKPLGTIVRMTCYTADYLGEFTPSAEIQDLAYYTYDQRDIVGPVDQIIFDDLKQKEYCENKNEKSMVTGMDIGVDSKSWVARMVWDGNDPIFPRSSKRCNAGGTI